MEPISIEVLMSTDTYKDLISKKQTIPASFILKRNVRQIISNGLQVFKHSGEIPNHITSNNLRVVKDLISMGV